ncbi:DUF1800 domain-containing protein [Marinivivus vitaminiproducens]|uniref:DUF1800 domain-containing protein n=1 Tax=Marinivivus vitaminiproducens TaxID=3035935 RepID=UPI0027A6C186|nr:DUF1800 domain-containing protein [Geminicoccaceae bacterium SCSIO 64248]
MGLAAAALAANRFGLGARPGDLDRIAAAGARTWLHGQLEPLPPSPFLDGLDGSDRHLATLVRRSDRARMEAWQENMVSTFRTEAGLHLLDAVDSDRPFACRLVRFWSNHFAITVRKDGRLRSLVGAYEREAIRPHVMGAFRALLGAVVRHPAMLLYLDQNTSLGGGSRAAARRDAAAEGSGVNENLARELMELHTLGVDGGYGQADVRALANILTGWTVGLKDEVGTRFRPGRHEPGDKRLLGVTIAEDGAGETEQALDLLARHPSTARFVATKLCRHFIADEPDGVSVRAVAERFQETGGDLPAVYERMIEVGLAGPLPPKLKRPDDLVLSAARATGFHKGRPAPLLGALRRLGQMPYQAVSPKGYDDEALAWAAPGAVLDRIAWSGEVASRAPELGLSPQALGVAVLGPDLDEELRLLLERAPSRVEGLALLIASPAFQKR